MINKSKIVTFLLINVILFVLLQVLKYEDYQYSIQQEQSQLYSYQNRFVTSTLEMIIRDIEDDYRVFYELQNNKQIVRAFYSNAYPKWTPSLRSGRFFEKADTKEVVVGEEIYRQNENEYEYSGRKYKIIGVFTGNTSYLKNMVLINDSSLFPYMEQNMIIDSNKTIRSRFGEISLDNSLSITNGLGKVQNHFMHAFKWVAIGLVAFSVLFLVNYFYATSQRENYIEYLLGKSFKKIIQKNTLILLISYLANFLWFVYCSTSYSINLKVLFLKWGFLFFLETLITFWIIVWRRKIYASNGRD